MKIQLKQKPHQIIREIYFELTSHHALLIRPSAQISRKPKSNVPKPRKIIVIRSPKKEWKDITERDFYPRGKLYLNNLAASSNLFGKLLTTDEDGKLVNFDDKIIFDHKGQYTPENTPKTLSVCWESLLQSDLAKKRRRYSSMTNIPEDERWTALGVWLDWLCKKELNLGPDNDILKTTLRTLAHFIGDKTGFVSALSDYKSVASP